MVRTKNIVGLFENTNKNIKKKNERKIEEKIEDVLTKLFISQLLIVIDFFHILVVPLSNLASLILSFRGTR